jgi:hypothetical protein
VEWARAPSPTLEALIALLPRCDGDKRIVYVAASLGGSSDSVVTLLPNARWLRVVAHRASAGTALPVMERCLDIQVDALLDAPVERIEHLLAFLGEPMVEDLIRHVIDHYPRRSRRRPSESAALQGAHA